MWKISVDCWTHAFTHCKKLDCVSLFKMSDEKLISLLFDIENEIRSLKLDASVFRLDSMIELLEYNLPIRMVVMKGCAFVNSLPKLKAEFPGVQFVICK